MTTCDNTINLSSSQITRVKLIGMGIVCGLEVFRDTQCFISISKGISVTSAGHIICINDKTLKYYKPYTDPNNYFNALINCKAGAAPKKVTLFEFLEHREDNAMPIVPQNIDDVEASFLTGKVVLLYLEDDIKMTVRVLLIDEQDMWAILKCTCILNTHCIPQAPIEDEDISIFNKDAATTLPGDEELFNAVHKKYLLKPLAIRRFGYGSVDIGDLNLGDNLPENLVPNFNFTNAIGKADTEKYFAEYEIIIDEALQNLDDEIDKLHQNFGCMIDACHCKEKAADDAVKSPCNPVNEAAPTETGLQMHNIKIFKQYFTSINKKWAIYKKNRQPVESIQYFYGFVKDLCDTYNELLNELYELVNDCCGGTDCFPRHIMLGRIKEEVSFQPSIFRQGFEQPPVYNGNANRLQQIRFLHWRMVMMMKCFFVPDWDRADFSDECYYDVLAIEGEKVLGEQDPKLPVRITPGRMYNEPLGMQTIPFYYNLSNSPYSIQHYWNNMHTKHNLQDRHLSFFNKEIPGYTNVNSIIHPFVFSLTQFPFYRIEGHTGMKVSEAVAAIKNLRHHYAVNFEVLPLSFKQLKEQALNDATSIYGLEHTGGVQKGYTFLLLHNGEENTAGDAIVVADFQIPVLLVRQNNNTDLPNDEQTTAEKWRALFRKIGNPKTSPDNFEKLGLNEQLIARFKSAGINSLKQLSLLTESDIPLLAAVLKVLNEAINKNWFAAAAELEKKKIITTNNEIITKKPFTNVVKKGKPEKNGNTKK